MAFSFTPDLCKTHDWSPIAGAASQSAIAAVLAGFVFAGIIVIISVTEHGLKREAAQALKLLFTAFFGLAVTSYLLADMAGEQTCPRAETTEALAGGALGAFAVIMITSLTWLVVAFKRHDHNVLEFLRGLVYVSCVFVVLLLCTNSTTYLVADLYNGPQSVVDPALYATGGLFIVGGAIWIWRIPKHNSKATDVATTSDTAVNWCTWGALTYLALTSLATGVAASIPAKMWYPYPARWPIYIAAASSLILPLVVLTLAIGGLARTGPGRTRRTGAGDTST